MISDSQVLEAIRILKEYAREVKDSRGELYWDAINKNNLDFAGQHLIRYQAANNIEKICPSIEQWYRDSK